MGDATTVNGDMPQSAFIDHVTSYPAVSDGIAYYKGNPYGAKSLELIDASYAKFVKPTFPYLEKPAGYAKPYVSKADELGDKFLSKVDERVPVLKSETKELQGQVHALVHWPITKAYETTDWAFSTWTDEYKKCGGDGIVAGSKAAVTTPLIIGSQVLQWLSSFLQAKKGEAEQFIKDNKPFLEDKKNEAEKFAKDKKGDAEKFVNEKTDN